MQRLFRRGAALTLLALCLAAPACAQHAVGLDVSSTPKDGYTNATASNGKVYGCRYSGGDDGEGNVTIHHGDGPATVTVRITGDRKYTRDAVTFPDDPNHQLEEGPNPPTKYVAVVQDRNTATQEATYKVSVADPSEDGVTIPCDPKIIND